MAPFTLDEVVKRLEEVSGVASIDPDSTVRDVDVDSLDVLELVYTLEEEADIEISRSKLEGLEKLTIRELYTQIFGMGQ